MAGDKRSNSESNSGGGHNNKRPRHEGGHRKRQPRRGGPGMLLTCEAGRESRCRGEGLDLIRHYYYAAADGGGNGAVESSKVVESQAKQEETTSSGDASADRSTTTTSGTKELSLEEEIALLQNGASAEEVLAPGAAAASAKGMRKNRHSKRKNAPFAVYDTACKGTVIVLCTLPGCHLVEVEGDKDKGIDGAASNDDVDEAAKGKDEEEKEEEEAKASAPWDPVVTMQQITHDLLPEHVAEAAKKDIPSSRFVTRLIPLQATCFTSVEEIVKTARPLLEKFLLPEAKKRWEDQQDDGAKDNDGEKKKKKPTTFEISFKRRFCSNVRREAVIDALAKLVGELTGNDGSLGVDLSDPDYTIQIEVVKNICGMSVVPHGKRYKKFNLMELREGGLREASAENS